MGLMIRNGEIRCHENDRYSGGLARKYDGVYLLSVRCPGPPRARHVGAPDEDLHRLDEADGVPVPRRRAWGLYDIVLGVEDIDTIPLEVADRKARRPKDGGSARRSPRGGRWRANVAS
mgnify:FL=1